MQIGTAIFTRIVQESAQKEREAAIKALVTTMGETARFGTFGPEILYEAANSRIDSWKDGKRGW